MSTTTVTNHAATVQSLVLYAGEDAHTQDPGIFARLAVGAALFKGRDLPAVLEPDLFRLGRLRRGGRFPDVLRQARQGTESRGMRHARRAAALPEELFPFK